MSIDNTKTYLQAEINSFIQGNTVTTHFPGEEVIADMLSLVVTTYTDTPIELLETNSTVTQTVILNNTTPSQGVFESKLIIPLYVIIFLLAVIGNLLVLVTLVQNKRMRTVTNVYLLNLAVSDLLLGVFCMPFTLVGQVLRNFIFGAAMCKLIPYFQAVSVSVGVWTLVAISLERYFAICRPLKSRRWQTQFHAYKMIAFVWAASLIWSSPVLVVSSLKAMKGKAKFKCREEWPSNSSEQAYNLFLDAMLLLVPLVIMSFSYSLIMSKLWKGLRREIQHNTTCQRQMIERAASTPTISDVSGKYKSTDFHSATPLRQHRLAPPPQVRSSMSSPINSSVDHQQNNKSHRNAEKSGRHHTTETVKMWIMKGVVQVRLPKATKGYQDYTKTKTTTVVPRCELTTPTTTEHVSNGECGHDCKMDETTYTFSRHVIRSNYMGKSIEAKKKVIRMLFAVVAEFFVCWAPLHVLNTWYLFYPNVVYEYVGSTGISLVQLLAYISSCCNPITYCFMNRKFRQAFLGVFNCYRLCCCCVCLDPEMAEAQARGGLQRNGLNKVLQNNSDVSGNDSTLYVGRASTIGRSEVLVLEAEDRV